MSIDRQAIERRDFPIARRGYDPAAVDAHLRALADEIEQLQHERGGPGAETSLAAAAGTQVQSILAAAEAAAADIERQSRDSASTTREDADRDAARKRESAIEQAREHVAAVAQATAVLLERVGSLDGEVDALVESLRSGAGRLAADLAAVETNMGELYDAAAGKADAQTPARAVAGEATQPSVPLPPLPPEHQPPRAAPAASQPPTGTAEGGPRGEVAQGSPPASPPAEAAREPVGSSAGDGDLDSARLIALNMALNGESRAATDRYLADHFQLAERQRLIDEVYAAIEG